MKVEFGGISVEINFDKDQDPKIEITLPQNHTNLDSRPYVEIVLNGVDIYDKFDSSDQRWNK